MTDYYEMEQEAAWEEYREELIADALKEISKDGISCYLFYYGDAIETRISECLGIAKELHAKKYYSSSVLSSCAAVEITIRYFILRPLVEGMFLKEEWADILTRRIVTGQAAKDRNMLQSILRFWEVDINSVKLSSGETLWQVLHEKIWKARNYYAHRGEPVSEEVSAQAIEVATILAELAKEVLTKATGRSKRNRRWGSQECGRNPFSEE